MNCQNPFFWTTDDQNWMPRSTFLNCSFSFLNFMVYFFWTTNFHFRNPRSFFGLPTLIFGYQQSKSTDPKISSWMFPVQFLDPVLQFRQSFLSSTNWFRASPQVFYLIEIPVKTYFRNMWVSGMLRSVGIGTLLKAVMRRWQAPAEDGYRHLVENHIQRMPPFWLLSLKSFS